MGDFIVITGDKAMFDGSSFGDAKVVAQPGTLIGKGKAKVTGKPVCVDGDEMTVVVPGCVYTTSKCTIPGSGTLFIKALGGDQKAKKVKSGGKPVILKGSQFDAKFMVMVPAQQPSSPSPIPDTMLQYMGKGSFQTTNTKVKAS